MQIVMLHSINGQPSYLRFLFYLTPNRSTRCFSLLSPKIELLTGLYIVLNILDLIGVSATHWQLSFSE